MGEMIIEKNPETKDIEKIKDRLREFNNKIVGEDNHQLLNYVIKDKNKEVIGGLLGGTYWGWLYVDIFFIDENYRSQQIGSKILKMAEGEAVRRGCRYAHLDTMSFQALGFYEKQGYKIMCEFKDLPQGHSKYMLVKELIK